MTHPAENPPKLGALDQLLWLFPASSIPNQSLLLVTRGPDPIRLLWAKAHVLWLFPLPGTSSPTFLVTDSHRLSEQFTHCSQNWLFPNTNLYPTA